MYVLPKFQYSLANEIVKINGSKIWDVKPVFWYVSGNIKTLSVPILTGWKEKRFQFCGDLMFYFTFYKQLTFEYCL